jgi:hypothetical protein
VCFVCAGQHISVGVAVHSAHQDMDTTLATLVLQQAKAGTLAEDMTWP